MNNREARELVIQDFDLRPFEAELYTQQLVQFMDLDVLALESCNLESFFPKGLGKLRRLSLMGNMVPSFSQLILSDESEEEARGRGNEFGRSTIPEINLTHLNISDNQFEAFPWVAIHKMGPYLKKINMSRNNLTTLMDDNERKIYKQIRLQVKQMAEPFSVFKELTSLDLSSNKLRHFPEELINLTQLRELNLMNNKIKSVPTAFFMAPDIQ